MTPRSDGAWFHGGVRGLKVGDWILSPDASGSENTLSGYAREMGAPHGTRTDVVYLTSRQDTARVYAALYPDGALYRVEPDAPCEPDPDAPGEAVMCARARIVEVVRSRVVFAHRTPESWFRLLAGGSS